MKIIRCHQPASNVSKRTSKHGTEQPLGHRPELLVLGILPGGHLTGIRQRATMTEPRAVTLTLQGHVLRTRSSPPRARSRAFQVQGVRGPRW